MVQVNYVEDRDELEVIFCNEDAPEVFKFSNGIFFEFSTDKLSAIILPNFARMTHIPNLSDVSFEFDSFEDELLKIKIDEQVVNIKIDLSEIENY